MNDPVSNDNRKDRGSHAGNVVFTIAIISLLVTWLLLVDSKADQHEHDHDDHEHQTHEHAHDAQAHEDEHNHEHEHDDEKPLHDDQDEHAAGHTEIPASIAVEMGIQTETVGPRTLTETRTFTGRVQTNPNHLSRVRPRFPGIVRKINVELGDTVRAGDKLAIVESNESLQNYYVEAPIDGQVIKRDLQIGEATGDAPLFIIADYSSVWVELDVFVRDLSLVREGQSAVVETLDDKNRITASIDWISPLTAHASQSVLARLNVNNKAGVLRPGQFIRSHVTVAHNDVALAVRRSALQRYRGHDVVYARFGDRYEVRMLQLGRSNHDWIEVLDGIEAGTEYVTNNSYLVKADIEKAGAGHDHAH